MAFWQHTASWPDFAALTGRRVGDENSLRRKFWRRLKREAARIPFVEEALTAYYCAFDRQTPVYVKAVLLGAIAYFIIPDDLIPDYIPLIGYADDAAVIATAMKLMSAHIKPEHREAAREMLARLRDERSSRT